MLAFNSMYLVKAKEEEHSTEFLYLLAEIYGGYPNYTRSELDDMPEEEYGDLEYRFCGENLLDQPILRATQ